MKYENNWFHLQFFLIANFHVLGFLIPKNKFRAKKIRQSRGVTGFCWTKFVSMISQPP
jgi:hypothetical protein